jgi:hypothetical protein
MSDVTELQRRIDRLEDIESIKQLKYRYWRHLDLKQWDELAKVFSEDAVACYSSGKYEFKGLGAIMGFLSDALGHERGSVTIHHGHHPEIELVSATSARGTWALYNYMFNVTQNRGIRIGAYYDDRYVKLAGNWKIQSIGYTTLFHEEWKRDDMGSLKLLEI